MWGQSPISRITANNRDCSLVQDHSKFVYLAVLRPAYNTLNISLNPSLCVSMNDLKLMIQVYFVQLSPRPNRSIVHPAVIGEQNNGY